MKITLSINPLLNKWAKLQNTRNEKLLRVAIQYWLRVWSEHRDWKERKLLWETTDSRLTLFMLVSSQHLFGLLKISEELCYLTSINFTLVKSVRKEMNQAQAWANGIFKSRVFSLEGSKLS